MIITRLEYVDKTNKNTFLLKFNDILTLLVGVSGVGKTRVLNCINTMKKIVLVMLKILPALSGVLILL